jgi:hypothetical protein
VTPEECRAEALRRVAESDRLFDEYRQLPASQQGELSLANSHVAHLRQTAAVFAALAD